MCLERPKSEVVTDMTSSSGWKPGAAVRSDLEACSVREGPIVFRGGLVGGSGLSLVPLELMDGLEVTITLPQQERR